MKYSMYYYCMRTDIYIYKFTEFDYILFVNVIFFK